MRTTRESDMAVRLRRALIRLSRCSIAMIQQQPPSNSGSRRAINHQAHDGEGKDRRGSA